MKRYGIVIGDYIAYTLLDPNTAKKIIRQIRMKMESLSEMPQRIKTIDEEPWGSYGIRKIRVKNYYFYFWINEDKQQVQIVAIIYVHRNQELQVGNIIIDK